MAALITPIVPSKTVRGSLINMPNYTRAAIALSDRPLIPHHKRQIPYLSSALTNCAKGAYKEPFEKIPEVRFREHYESIYPAPDELTVTEVGSPSQKSRRSAVNSKIWAKIQITR
ncbi:hypothetical protein QR680_004374 [Steinernema hermaphroditum]|uniref:Uncharacterized protein n=1 Tax=Steinernema hermaphroditum TaxID=289476 RepID=A0AA39LT34_9BILA|nr:hypothetical protein QR680_004374 [Steinernema hermaphroditum]